VLGILAAAVVGLVLLVGALYLWPASPPASLVGRPHALPDFRHVFIIMMENESLKSLQSSHADPYIHQLFSRDELDTAYYGVTHVSLPNYVAVIAGSTFGTHSDNPTQTFHAPTLAGQLDARHISWEAAMGGLPYPGYTGNWYPPGRAGLPPMVMPPGALYAKKHDPFMLFPAIVRRDRQHIVPLTTLGHQLARGGVPRFIWISPDLCQDMHGQPVTPGAECPSNDTPRLIHDGDRFLQAWVPAITRSAAFRQGPSVLFIVWDEANNPGSLAPGAVRAYLAAGPAAPPLVAALPWLGRFGGGQVPLIVVTNAGPAAHRVRLWADHYSLLKTVEAAWHLPYLGAARNPSVPTLWPFFYAPTTGR
jgi:hypothetical protein